MVELHTLVLNPRPPFQIIVNPIVDNPILIKEHLWKLRLSTVNPGEPYRFEVFVDNVDKLRVKAADKELFKQATKLIKSFDPFVKWVEANITKEEKHETS